MADPEGTRKLEAILAADVAGYSRLMQEDDEATVATLEAYRGIFQERVQAHRGRVVDMAGDSVLAVFDAATAAVRAAFEIQNDLGHRNEALPEAQRMHFRIGVNLGEVIEKPDGTVYGDGVNVAARLESIGDPGGVSISGTVYDQVKNRLEMIFDSIGEHTFKNITEPIRVYRIRFAAEGRTRAKHPLAPAMSSTSSKPWVVGEDLALQLPDKPAIAVLPFVNMSDDPQQEYFSDGMTEDVITSLSKLSGLFVIARNSAFTYKGRAVKPQQVSLELGVRYVLEGSVRKAQDRVRVTAQLIDAITGYHLWAERYDGELKDIFALQDGITEKIVLALAPKLKAGEHSSSGRSGTENIEAYDHVLRGIALLRKYSKESCELAHQTFEKAIRLDPGYARGYVWLAWAYYNKWNYQWTDDPATLDHAIDAAKRALALDDSFSDAHTVMGWFWLWKGQHDLSITELERAVWLDPNSALAYAFLGETLNFAGRPDEAVGFIKRALRLDPNSPAFMVFHMGHSSFLLRRYDEAIAAMQDALRRSPNFPPAHRMLAVTYAELDRQEEARAEVAEMLRISPGTSVDSWEQRDPYKNKADGQRIIDGLRKAGLT
jgi:adenylate cyclase